MNFKSIGKMVLASSLLFSGMYANAETININDNLALETVGNLINPTVDSLL